MLKKKFERYLRATNESFSVLHHELNKMATLYVINEKRTRGVEDVETV